MLIALPRTAIPDQLPALRISRTASAAVFAEDKKLAAQAPTTPAALELEALLHEKGESERQAVELQEQQAARSSRITVAMAVLRANDGTPGIIKLRARAVQQMEAALNFTLPPEQVQGVLGSFATTLREISASRDGVIVAPDLVVHTIYKVRWNVIMGLPLLFALSPTEQTAYNGWFALHAADGPIDARARVLTAYEKGGGHNVQEARGVLAYLAGNPRAAIRYFDEANAKRPSLKLRNYLLAARRADYTMRHEAPLR